MKIEKLATQGRPTKYGPVAEKVMNDYYDRYRKLTRKNVPFIEELCLELDIDESTLWRWTEKHEFCKTYIGRLKTLQKVRLMQRALYKKGRVSGEVFLLKANHKMVEAEKRRLLPDEEPQHMSLIIDVDDKSDPNYSGKSTRKIMQVPYRS